MAKRTAADRSMTSRFLARAATHGAGGVELVEMALRRTMLVEGIDRAALSVMLGCDSDGVDRISLCTLPRADNFQPDVESIAALGPANSEILSQILHRYAASNRASLAAESGADYDSRCTDPSDEP